MGGGRPGSPPLEGERGDERSALYRLTSERIEFDRIETSSGARPPPRNSSLTARNPPPSCMPFASALVQAQAPARTSETNVRIPDRKDMVSRQLDSFLGAQGGCASVVGSVRSLSMCKTPLAVLVNVGIRSDGVEPKNVRYAAWM